MLNPLLSRHWRLVLLGLIVALVALVAVQAFRVYEDYRGLQAHATALDAIVNQALSGPGASAHLQQAATELEAVDRQAHDLEANLGPALGLLPLLAPLPDYGGDIAAAPHLLAMIHHGVNMARPFMRLAPAVLAAPNSRTGAASRVAQMTTLLKGQSGEIAAASQELALLSQERQQIDLTHLSSRTARYLTLLDRGLAPLQSGLTAARLAPDWLGANGEKRYLVVLQNTDEIRATGGYLSSAGVLTLKNGEIVALTFSDSANVTNLKQPHPFPPTPLMQYMSAGAWLFRDANWSPDFPTSARAMQSLYQLDQGVATDGVVALDEIAVGQFLDLLGGVDVLNYQAHVTGQNLLALTQKYYGAPLDAQPGENLDAQMQHRKDFVGEVMRAAVKQVQSGSIDPLAWAPKLLSLARSRHLQAYLNDAQAEDLLRTYQVDGGLHPTPGEYLSWVDSNMGYNKVGPHIQRALAAQYTLTAGAPTSAHVTMTYTNTSAAGQGDCVRVVRYDPTYSNMQQGCFWNYARLYVEDKSQFVSASGAGAPEAQPAEGATHAIGFGSFAVIPTASSRQLTFDYQGRVLSAPEFQLLVQKQAGLANLPVSIEIDFPSAWKVGDIQPAPAESQPGRVLFRAVLNVDQLYHIAFATAGGF